MILVNQGAIDVSNLAHSLAEGYLTHVAILSIASDPRSMTLSPLTLPGQLVPIGHVDRKDGTQHTFHFKHYLGQSNTDPNLSLALHHVWLAGSLIRLGDALALNSYFDRAPELELVRHLRNGVAHGNKFRIDNPSKLKKFPAHNRLAWVRSDLKTDFEITPKLQGCSVLFEFMGPGDVLDLLKSVNIYLRNLGNGWPLRLKQM
jgi:hypothetical protein